MIKPSYKTWLEMAKADNGTSSKDSKDLFWCIPDDVKTILAIGTGTSTELKDFRKAGYDVTGITLVEADARSNGALCMDMHLLGFRDSSFDLVWAKDSFEHAISPIIAFSEIARVTKKFIILSIPGCNKWGSCECHYGCLTYEQLFHMAEKLHLASADNAFELPGYRKLRDDVRGFLDSIGYNYVDFDLYSRNMNTYLFKK